MSQLQGELTSVGFEVGESIDETAQLGELVLLVALQIFGISPGQRPLERAIAGFVNRAR